MDTRKVWCGTLWHILDSGIAAVGHFSLNLQESLKYYRLKVRKVTPDRHVLHHMVNHTFQHTFTHIIGPLASFGGIPVLRGSPPSKRLSVGPGWSSPQISPHEVPPMYFS